MPDNVLGIAQDEEQLHHLDVAFFRVGDARSGLLVKFTGGESEDAQTLRGDFERHGFEVRRLEEGRFRFVEEGDPAGGRTEVLRGMLEEGTDWGRPVFANFNWKQGVDAALGRQEEISEFVEESLFVVKTSVLEEILDEWPGADIRRAQVAHSDTIWLSGRGWP